MESTAPAKSAETAPAESLQMVCSEVWGGNRPIHAPVELPGMRGMLFSRPCQGGRGGDVHYLSVCGSGVFTRVCIADVVGHGETVARVSAEMHAHMRRCMNRLDQRRVLSQLNRILEVRGLDAMTTAAAVTYYPPTQKLSVSYAGHPPGWYYSHAADRWERLTLDDDDESQSTPTGEQRPRVNLPLAVEPTVKYTRRRVQVALGDRLVLVTDGVLEAPGADRTEFGDDRMEALLQGHRHESCEALGSAILSALGAHCGGDLSHDDVTFVVLEFVPGPHSSHFWLAIKNRVMRPRGNSTQGMFGTTGTA